MTFRDRSEVQRAVRRGETPRDATLADAVVDRARRVQRQTGSRWPILVLGGLVALSAVTVVTKAYQGLLRPDDVGLLGCWVVAIIAWTWHTRRARRAAGDAEVAASPTHGRTSGT